MGSIFLIYLKPKNKFYPYPERTVAGAPGLSGAPGAPHFILISISTPDGKLRLCSDSTVLNVVSVRSINLR